METTITIQGIEQKTSQAGKVYHSITTEQGVMSCFEKSISDVLLTKIGQQVGVEIKESNGFKNIRKILAKLPVVSPSQTPPSADKFAEARKEKNSAMYVSYVKDLIVSGVLPDKAIEIIKKTIAEFEK